MDYALEQYTRGYNELLDYAADHLEQIKTEGKYKDSYTAMSIAGLLPRPDCNVHSSAKGSLQRHVAANIASYLELMEADQNTGFPLGRDPDPEGFPNALENFIRVGSDLDDFKLSQRILLKRTASAVMPFYFARSDGAAQTKSGSARNRNYSLLINSERDKLLAVMWLLPGRHKLCSPLGATQGNLVKLGSGEIFTSNSTTAILVPLELGRNGWQQRKFIDPATANQAAVKTAYLIRRAGDYFLNVSFDMVCEDAYKPESFLGIDRGVFETMAYAVVDSQGRIKLMHHNDDGYRDACIQAGRRVQEKQRLGQRISYGDYQRKNREAILHRLINDIIEVAKEHRAKIIMEDLNINISGAFFKAAWQKIYRIFEYKCRLNGVPLWKDGVWAAYSSQICIYCGGLNRGRKRDGSPFVCPHCSAIYHSDAGAAVNIARRALYRRDDWKDRGGYRAFHRSFARFYNFANDGQLTTK